MAGTYFIKFDGINADGTDTNHKQWIDALDFNWNAQQPLNADPGTQQNRLTGHLQLGDFSFSKQSDSSSPQLFQSMAKGKVFKTVEVHSVQTGDTSQKMHVFKFSDVAIRSFSQAGHGTEQPHEGVSAQFVKVDWSFTPYDEKGKPKGPIVAGYDAAAAKAS
jgi:type VI secretion system secreted protein Hcp